MCMCVYLSICTSMCMCAKCSISKSRYHYCNVTVITGNIQVQHPEREREQAANRGYFTVDRCICTCVYDRRKRIMWEQSKLHVNFLVLQVFFFFFFFPLRFLSAEMHTLVMGMGSMCVYVCVCARCKVFFLCAAFFSACVCMWVNDCAIIAVVVVEEWWLTD